MEAPARDAFDESVAAVREANAGGIPLKLLGGQAVRLLCPFFPNRARDDQDMDFACVSSKKRQVVELNEKDVHDVLRLLSGFEVRPGHDPKRIGMARVRRVVADDWGWWPTE